MAQEKNQVEEIDLLELVNAVWSKKRLILKIIVVFFLMGVFVSLTSKTEYIARCKLISEIQGTNLKLGGLGGLANLAGFDVSSLGGESGMLTPKIFPEIIRSTPFVENLINSPVYFENADTLVSSLEYFKSIDRPSIIGILGAYTIGLPGLIIRKAFSFSNTSEIEEGNFIRYTKQDWTMMENYKERFSVDVDPETGIIEITGTMPDAVAAAAVVDVLVNALKKEVIEYKLEKIKSDLQFVEHRFSEAKNQYEQVQAKVAKFIDQNRDLSNSVIKTEHQRLNYEMGIAFEIYKGLTTQLERTKILVKKETPVFKILEPTRIPESKSKPRRKLTTIVFTVVGLFIGILYSVILKNFKWRNN